VDTCVDRWLGDLEITRRHLGRPGHAVARYEALVRDPASTLRALCRFLDLPWDPSMLEGREEATGGLVLESEPWKAGAGGEVRSGGTGKFRSLFDEDQRAAIRARLSVVDLEWISAGPGSSSPR
jgi:hypothetical protein